MTDIGRLTYYEVTEEGAVKFGQAWKDEHPVFQLDCLLDWMADLRVEFDRIHAIAYPIDPKQPEGTHDT